MGSMHTYVELLMIATPKHANAKPNAYVKEFVIVSNKPSMTCSNDHLEDGEHLRSLSYYDRYRSLFGTCDLQTMKTTAIAIDDVQYHLSIMIETEGGTT
jgi:hypothetical protein